LPSSSLPSSATRAHFIKRTVFAASENPSAEGLFLGEANLRPQAKWLRITAGTIVRPHPAVTELFSHHRRKFDYQDDERGDDNRCEHNGEIAEG
jgi:hypothetical protein